MTEQHIQPKTGPHFTGSRVVGRIILDTLASGEEIDRATFNRVLLEMLTDVQETVKEINERQQYHASAHSVELLQADVRTHDGRLKCLEEANADERLRKLEAAQLTTATAEATGKSWTDGLYKHLGIVLSIAGFVVALIALLLKK